jgi:hypothetical protein
VSCADNRVGVEKSATAVVRPRELNADDEREIALGSCDASHNVRGVFVPVVREFLRDSHTGDNGGNRKGNEDGFGVHVDSVEKREAGRSLSWRVERLTDSQQLVTAPYL